MLKNLRNVLKAAGGAQTLVAIAAVAWGLGRLQALGEERQAYIAQLDELLAERLHPTPAAAEADAVFTYTDDQGRARDLADGTLLEEQA